MIGRIHRYRDFIARSLVHENVSVGTVVALDMNDKPYRRGDTPVFGFQKERHMAAILLPDIDFLRGDLYRSDRFGDAIAYADKTPTAVFVGGTTGGGTITQEAVRSRTVPRIRSAVYFKDHPHISFTLPAISSCDSPETEALIRSLGVSGPRVSLEAQFRHRFLISMDGHGATCQRVALALRSNSVLLKYESPHVLYYFDRLIPWFHYIPIFADPDVERVVEIEQNAPGTFAYITREASRFYEEYLSPAMIMRYTARLLAMYAEIFPLADSPLADHAMPESAPAMTFDALLHIENEADQWFRSAPWHGPRGGGLHHDGCSPHPPDRSPTEHMSYRAMYAGGTHSDWTQAGKFCGTRGQRLAITGLAIRVGGAEAASYRCSYTAIGLNGEVFGPVDDGAWCRADQPAGLEAFQVAISRVDG